MFSNQTVFVTFTLYEKPAFYGFDYKEDSLSGKTVFRNFSFFFDKIINSPFF